MAKKLEFDVPPDCAGTRLDRCLSRLVPGSSRVFLQKMIRDGRVLCNGKVEDLPRRPVPGGCRISLEMPDTSAPLPTAEPFAFDILYEDDQMLIIDKPPGVVVHPAAGNPDGTVMNALLSRYPGLTERLSADDTRPGIVHRLDKDTSGCLAAAKTPEAQFKLCTAFAERRTAKCYLALVRGTPAKERGELTTLIGRHPVNRQKMAVVERNGKIAVTRYELLGTGMLDKLPVSLLKVVITTGRTHQIRVHMASLRTPVLGDALYGGAVPGVARQMLHAWTLTLPHPLGGEKISATAPLPPDFLEILTRCGLKKSIDKILE